jgi:hypothetical protein
VNGCFPFGKLLVPEQDRHHHQRQLFSRHVVSEIKKFNSKVWYCTGTPFGNAMTSSVSRPCQAASKGLKARSAPDNQNVRNGFRHNPLMRSHFQFIYITRLARSQQNTALTKGYASLSEVYIDLVVIAYIARTAPPLCFLRNYIDRTAVLHHNFFREHCCSETPIVSHCPKKL